MALLLGKSLIMRDTLYQGEEAVPIKKDKNIGGVL